MAERHKQFLLEPEDPALSAPVLREVGGASHVPDVSLTLRLARERAGYEIKDVAEVLRIRAAHLEAIEAGRFKNLPGPTYITGFLRSYADFLGLDRDEIVSRYREEIGAAGRQKLSFPVPSYEGRMPRAWLIVVALIVVGLAYGGWHYYSTRDNGERDTVAEPPAEATAQVADSAPDQAAPAPSDQIPVTSDASSLETGDASVTAQSDAGSVASAGTAADAPSDVGSAAGVGGSLFDSAGTAATGAASTSADAAASDATNAAPAPADTSTASSSAEGPAAGVSSSGSLWDNQGAPASATAEPATPEPGSESSGELGVALAEDGDFGASVPEPVRFDETDLTALEGGSGATVADTPGTAETAPVMATASADARVVITARADSWVQIQGPGNELVMTRILRPGESYPVPERPGLVMVTGNAGGLEVVVDGRPVGSLGAMGVVKRGIALDPDSLRATYGSAGQ
jgi:cytoskeleton protein RodZ